MTCPTHPSERRTDTRRHGPTQWRGKTEREEKTTAWLSPRILGRRKNATIVRWKPHGARGQVCGHLRVRCHKTHHLARSATQMHATRGLRRTVSRARKIESATIPGAYIPPPHLRGRAGKFSAPREEFSARLEKFSGRPGEFFGRAGDALGRPVGFCPRPENSLGQPENSLPRDSAPVPRRRAFSAPPGSQCGSPHALNSPPAFTLSLRSRVGTIAHDSSRWPADKGD
jgi:hypothetical protein